MSSDRDASQSDRFVSPAPAPTPYERELLTILGEECAEVIVRASKASRFGPTEVQTGQPYSNATRLAAEVGDVLEVVERCIRAGLLDPHAIGAGQTHKRHQLAKFMQTREMPSRGTLGTCEHGLHPSECGSCG